ncbi:MAG: keto-deoxy-phosphogluconate aldolase, partial [Thermoguttaceae bacterium]
MLPREMVEGMRRSGIVAVLVIDRAEDAVPLARALGEGGVQFIELTLRTPAALDALRAIRAE